MGGYMELKTVKVSTLRAHPENYNTHPEEQLVELEKSLDQFSQFKNIVVNPDNIVLAGHGLVEAAKRKGIDTLDAYVFVGTTEQEKALLLADNATPFLALPDADKLNDLLESFPSLDDIPGITDDWIHKMGVGTFDIDTVDEIEEEEIDSKNETVSCPKCGFTWQK
jgi:ParB-like chromosome segregation protein Spo0J